MMAALWFGAGVFFGINLTLGIQIVGFRLIAKWLQGATDR